MSDATQGVLGRQVQSPEEYQPELLYPLSRETSRQTWIKDSLEISFLGLDIWNLYEISWWETVLGRGKIPRTAVGQMTIPASSSHILESKSVKLYLNSLNQAQFPSEKSLLQTLHRDLRTASGCSALHINLQFPPERTDSGNLDSGNPFSFQNVHPQCLDLSLVHTPVHEGEWASILSSSPRAELVEVLEGASVEELLFTHQFRSVCPVTGQPDWATIYIHYHGKKINPRALLLYLLQYRRHPAFHETCTEMIFSDILANAKPEWLLVLLQFTRRGGIDINALRWSQAYPDNSRLSPGLYLARTFRQ